MAKRVTVGAAQKYLVALTGKTDITVLNQPNAAASHVGNRIVHMDLSEVGAWSGLFHEKGHIDHTPSMLMRLVSGPNKVLGNMVEDIRAGRADYADAPGAHYLYQTERLNPILPRIYEEGWLFQSVKVCILDGLGFTFDESRLQPEATTVLANFRAGGFADRIAAIADDDLDGLLAIIEEVAHLWDNQNLTQPEQESEPSDEPSDERGDDTGCGGWGVPSTEQDEGEPTEEDGDGGVGESDDESADETEDGTGGGSGPGKPTEDDGTDPTEGGTPGEPDDDASEGSSSGGGIGTDTTEANPGSGTTSGGGQGGEPVETGSEKSRGWWDEYDADERRNKSDTDKKNGRKKFGPTESDSLLVEDDEEVQKVNGGPDANALQRQARTLQRDWDRWERETRVTTDDWEDEEDFGVDAKGADESLNPAADKEVAKFADIDKVVGSVIDLTAATKATGAVGYEGRRVSVLDGRTLKASPVDVAKFTAATAPLAAYLAKVVKTYLQTRASRNWQNDHRSGRLDVGRVTRLAMGNLRVYKQKDADSNERPSVTLLVDSSGSMRSQCGNGMRASDHAAAATLMLSEALAQAGVPFEVSMFDENLWAVKSYTQPWNAQAREAVVGAARKHGDDTYAGEALAFGWVRANTRSENRRVIIMVTDGAVAANTKAVVAGIAKQPHAVVIGIGIGRDDISDTFPESISVSSAAELPGQFAVLLRRLVTSGRL